MNAPTEVVALAEERLAAKAAKDFARADQLRDEIAVLGWLIADKPGGYALNPKPAFTVYSHLADLPTIDTTARVSVGLIVDGWAEDALRCIDSIRQHSTNVLIIALVVADLPDFTPANVTVLHLDHDPGWGPAASRLAEISSSPLHVLMDFSTVFDGDAIALMQNAMTDDVVATGWKGALVDLDDQWRSVVDRGPGEVDVLLGYLMMVKRDALLATDTPHTKAKFYRNADLELSLALRENGGRLLALDLPVHQDRHHGYHDSEPEFRDRESKRNYDRILARFRGREEILSPRR